MTETLKKMTELVAKLEAQEQLLQQQGQTIEKLQSYVTKNSSLTYKPEPPPHFFGDKRGPTAREWIFQMELYLNMMDNAPRRVPFATTYFRGPAATWWFNKFSSATQEEIQTLGDWNTFIAIVKAEYEPVNPIRIARRNLDKIQQKYSVQQYVKEFREITQQIPGITAEELLHRFINGLKPLVQKEVDKTEPATLEQAIRLAEKIDYYEMKQRMPIDRFKASRNEPTPMELGTVNTKYLSNRRSQLSDEKKLELQRKGACYKCEKLGHRAKDCRSVKVDKGKGRL